MLPASLFCLQSSPKALSPLLNLPFSLLFVQPTGQSPLEGVRVDRNGFLSSQRSGDHNVRKGRRRWPGETSDPLSRQRRRTGRSSALDSRTIQSGFIGGGHAICLAVQAVWVILFRAAEKRIWPKIAVSQLKA